MKRLTALPPHSRHSNPDKLRLRQASLAAKRKNTGTVYREHVLAKCAVIRREMKA